MPTLFKKCANPQCHNRVLFGITFCATHRKESARYQDRNRETSNARGYDTQWTIIRDGYLLQHPLCEDCMQHGRTERASMVHHIIPIRDGGSDEEHNLAALCNVCHAKRHSKDVLRCVNV